MMHTGPRWEVYSGGGFQDGATLKFAYARNLTTLEKVELSCQAPFAAWTSWLQYAMAGQENRSTSMLNLCLVGVAGCCCECFQADVPNPGPTWLFSI